MKKLIPFLLSILLFSIDIDAQTTISIQASKDNTLYESTTGALSNGQGLYLFAGRTQNNGVRRALIQFDLSVLPSNAVIDTVVLALNVNRVNGAAGSDSLKLHVLTSNWGEGTSNAPGQEGGGASASSGDATWVHTFSPNSNWTNVGGDFNPVASAGLLSSGLGTEFFGSTQMTADVNNWLSNPNQNFGWIVIGNENPGISARRFASKDIGTNSAPSLRVTYLTSGIVESTDNKRVEIYPIPTENFLVVEHRRNVFTNQARVYDSKGQLVIDEKLDMDNRLNVERLESGIYFLELRTKDGNEPVSKKFVKN